ncbi:putative domain XH [Arabidopsis thaliana x Arabidopsis arenosa]|uniref:Factor of DNA methylation 1-5/IDN2 domain-containing protein n=2 Tax=Arabidopsis TaxID=3701 RepID=A0A178VMC0_ARATH|nr:putative domain XH [Arabidopsis thaliana x Arabidopsis arenosa]OAP06601.1 hypothetical protein AXX17_AT3G32290 [Arabidopsis thaliana]
MSEFPFGQSISGGGFPPATESSPAFSFNQSSNPSSSVAFSFESTSPTSSATPSFGFGTVPSSPSTAPSTSLLFGSSPSIFGATGSSPSSLPSSVSTTTHATSSVSTTQPSLGVTSSSGTAIGSPNMPSEIAEIIVKEVILVEGNSESQEHKWRSLKQENEVLKKRLKVMKEELEDKDSELEQREDLINALLVKERYAYDEILEAQKLLISQMRDLTDDRTKIRVKRMGHLDVEPFVKASKRRLTGNDTEVYAEWEENLRDPHWQPFKRVETGNIVKEVVDEEDEKLKNLREEWGEEVMNAVKTALEEVNEFNPSGRHVVPKLWNSERGRVATLREVIAHMTHEIKTLKRKKNLKHRKYL